MLLSSFCLLRVSRSSSGSSRPQPLLSPHPGLEEPARLGGRGSVRLEPPGPREQTGTGTGGRESLHSNKPVSRHYCDGGTLRNRTAPLHDWWDSTRSCKVLRPTHRV
ncbi:unnamed protein product [Pleuronectes platessa]|uniref:Uncharacterized protein n=1 Tax=Pleuronectes platessa TaxID=8262 RepID=A0A9N7V125_PLEPL|nr:unnamed protein product [Pleuronectes platessa]